MSRAIGFRAWVKPLKRYANGIDTILYHKACDVEGGGIWSVVCEEWDSEVYECDNIVVEQYTGLKDKNGKEIYEGDIVKMPDWQVKPKYEKVRFAKLSCGFEPFVCGCFECIAPDGEEVEVIGNIHENPELLENK